MIATHSCRARVSQITPLTDTIVQVILTPEQYIDYIAGQYLELIVGDEACAYSIANAPLGTQKYELHIRHSGDNSFYHALMAQMKQCSWVDIRLPLGLCHIDNLGTERSLLFLAAGTGYAPINAIMEQLLARGDGRSFYLYWAARTQQDLYLDEKVQRWAAHVPHLSYKPMLPDFSKLTMGEQVINDLGDDLMAMNIVISGPFDMVYATRDTLMNAGVYRDQLFSDAFAFEPTGE